VLKPRSPTDGATWRGSGNIRRWGPLGKMPLTKKAHEKSLTSIEQSLMAGPNCQAGQGKDGAAANLGQAWLL
jgi:hypothetical protein